MADFFDNQAELGSEEEDEDLDDETGATKPREKGRNADHVEDSSEEEDEEDEEAEREVREGFIVEDEEDDEERQARRRERKRRHQEEREEEEAGLDEEDLDLIGEANPEFAQRNDTERKQPKLKRLKRGHREERNDEGGRGAADLFDSDEEEDGLMGGIPHRRPGAFEDEMGDFIEEDFDDDEEGRDPAAEDAEVSRAARRGHAAMQELAGVDPEAMQEFTDVFGDGFDYDWALAMQEEDAAGDDPDQEEGALSKPIELKDVFEPSQLAERMMTDEDQRIRQTDIPERFQIARAPYKDLTLTDEQFKEEAMWVSSNLWKRKSLDPELLGLFQAAVSKILEFLCVDEFEVPFIFQHRRDYIIHVMKDAAEETKAQKLLDPTDLWTVFELDLKFRALIEKRNHLTRTYTKLQDATSLNDPVFEQMIAQAETLEELQDIQDYMHFEHSARLADLVLVNGTTSNGRIHRRPGASKGIWDRIRKSNVYRLTRAYGISADAFAQNALKEGRREYTEDPADKPEVMAASEDVLDAPDYSTAEKCIRAARAMFVEELVMSPKLRKVIRRNYYTTAEIDCHRTEKGMRKIDEQHPYYDFKYLRNQTIRDFVQSPGMFLRMLKAEEEGLLEIRVRLRDWEGIKKGLYADLESDNFSDVAEAWNKARREALDLALGKLDLMMTKNMKEQIKAECETQVALACRESYDCRLDQAPYKPRGEDKGTFPRVLAISNGAGSIGRDPMYWVFLEEDGRMVENGKFSDLSMADPVRGTGDGPDVKALVEVVTRRQPDVIGVSGFSVDSRKLFTLLRNLVKDKDLRSAPFRESEDDPEITELLEVVTVNDEIARLYQTSGRANLEFPKFGNVSKYCIALARYLQDPIKEYASLGKDVTSLTFDPDQSYLPPEKLMQALESAMVDRVNMCGVNINDAVASSYNACLLPYVAGLGPRKAQQLLKVINLNGGSVLTRAELVGDLEAHKLPAVGPRVWNNCTSFLWISFDETERESDYLDSTRIHPEDYELARKMAADALELDEEDVKAETDDHGDSAIVRRLVVNEEQEKVDDLVLAEYAEQLEKKFHSRKRVTLETIRDEFHRPYEEIRRSFEVRLPEDEVFTMFTGETRDSLCRGMIVPMAIRRVSDDSIEGRLDCGVEATVSALEISEAYGVSPRSLYHSHITVQAKVLDIDYKNLKAEMSLLDSRLRVPFHRDLAERYGDDWDVKQEAADAEALVEKNESTGRAQRVIKHPMFHPFNAAQAEEYLGSQARGDCVIRPSSKGMDHLAVTWKVGDNVYQHIDVLELDKDNEFALGRTLKIGGRWTYSDLDELIFNHVKAMARKVDEMTLHEKYNSGTKADTEKWLTTYTEANPRRSVYSFCIDSKHPGYFNLCFKAGQNAKVQHWPVKVIPGAYELQRAAYQNMKGLCDGFKMQFANMQKAKASAMGRL